PPKAPPITPGEIPGSGPTKMSVMAILSLVLGVLGFCTRGLGGLIGVILGIVALVSINKSAGRLGGQGLAIGGIVVSFAGLIVGLLVVVPAMLLPALAAAQQGARSAMSMNSLREVGLAAESYAMDYNDYLPRSSDWVDLLDAYVQDADALVSWLGSPEQGRAYAMNRLLDGLRYADVSDPQRTVLFFEAQFGSPLAGGPELLPAQPRYEQGYVIVFVDGHIENVIPEAIDSLVWQP
ncbi:MAG: DUF4190 domain-containing protein, partial [Phycisphaerales bacterium]